MSKKIVFILLIILNFSLLFILSDLSASPDQKSLNKFKFSLKQNDQDLDQYTRSQMKICSDNQGSDGCYKDLATVLMQQFSLKELLGSFAKNEIYPEIFSRCHEETHYLSRIAYQKMGNISKVYDQCDSTCHGGCYHGAIEQYLKDKKVPLTNLNTPETANVIIQTCGKEEDYPKPLIFNECIHGMGHAAMFITVGDLIQSLKICDLFPSFMERDSCYTGVFMENSSSSTNTDHPGKFIRADDILYPCDILDEKYLPECYRYQSSYFASYAGYNWAKVVDLCGQVPRNYQQECFQTIGTNQVGYTQDFSVIKKNCELIKDENFRNSCIQGVIISLGGRYVSQPQRMIEYCQIVNPENRKSCYQQIGATISGWYKKPQDAKKMCDQIKDENYSFWCQSNIFNL